MIGVELGGALKNIIAIGAGINEGLHYGENAKAAFITRALAEIARLGMAAGAHPLTFIGLAGIGDLIATCASPLSRNQQLGPSSRRWRKAGRYPGIHPQRCRGHLYYQGRPTTGETLRR